MSRSGHFDVYRFGPSRRLVVVLALLFGTGCAELSALGIPIQIPGFSTAALDERTVADGLRQALEVGSERASAALSRTGGFSDDPLIRLTLPSELDGVARALRTIGLGAKVDDLELSMNRAAEAAVGEAVPVFANAIESMTITDAFEILSGSESAATDYFRVHTAEALKSRFVPIAEQGMREVGLYSAYREIARQYERIPFTTMPAPDLESYIADRALDGLFGELAREEAKIREDPAARSTELLRRVFSD
jgi:hypothetical protein